jgi:hypothetical protein
MTARIPVDRNRAYRIAGALVGLAVVLGACTHTDEVVTASVPTIIASVILSLFRKPTGRSSSSSVMRGAVFRLHSAPM